MALEPIVDYFSFTVPVPNFLRNAAIHINEGTPFHAPRHYKRLYNYLTSDPDAKETKRSGRFNRMIHSEKFGFTYMDGDSIPVSLIQISGIGCAHLREKGYLENVLSDWHERSTRLDVAVDIETNCSVEGFARSRNNRRFENGGHERSNSGETWYIGRRTSDRHARVYRYEPPHPRCNLLRIEYELHDEQAKHASKSVLELGVSQVALQLGATFGWTHDDYDLPTSVPKFRTHSRDTSFGNTERWVHRAVQPALRRMAQSGKLQFLIDLHHWLGAIINEAQSEV